MLEELGRTLDGLLGTREAALPRRPAPPVHHHFSLTKYFVNRCPEPHLSGMEDLLAEGLAVARHVSTAWEEVEQRVRARDRGEAPATSNPPPVGLGVLIESQRKLAAELLEWAPIVSSLPHNLWADMVHAGASLLRLGDALAETLAVSAVSRPEQGAARQPAHRRMWGEIRNTVSTMRALRATLALFDHVPQGKSPA